MVQVQSASSWIEVGMENTLRPHEFENLIQRSRSNVWQSVYRPIYEIYPPLRPAFSIRPVVQPSGVEILDPVIFEQEAVEVDSNVQAIQAFRNKRLRTDVSWESMLNSQRVAGIRKWIGIISESLNSFDLGRRWSRLAPLGTSLAEGLKDVFEGNPHVLYMPGLDLFLGTFNGAMIRELPHFHLTRVRFTNL